MGILDIPKPFLYSYVLVALYALAFQLVTPTQLYLIKSLTSEGDAATQFALIRTLNGVAQLVGSLISGALVDRFGYRFVMLLSLVSSAFCYLLMALPTDDNNVALWLLYAAQVPTVFQHAILAARAFISLKSAPEKRAVYLGYVGVAYGSCGVVLGPALGGWASQMGLRLPAVWATLLSIVTIAIAVVAPTEVSNASSQTAADDKESSGSPPSASSSKKTDGDEGKNESAIGKYVTFLRTPLLALRLGLKLLFSFSLALFYSVFALVVADRFGLDSAGSGYLMSWFGVLGAVVQAFLIGALKARYTEKSLLVTSGAVMAASFAVLAFLSTPFELFAIAVPLVISTTLFQQINSSQVAEATPDRLKGTAVALDMSLFSGLRLITPALGTYLLKTLGYASIGASSSASALAMVAVMVLFPQSVEGGGVPAAVGVAAAAKLHDD